MKARQRLVALQAAQQGCNHLRWQAGATTRTRRCRQCWVLNAVARLATRLTPPTRHALPRRRHFEAHRSLHRTYRERIAVWGRLDCVRLPRNALRRWAVEVIDLDPADVDDGARRQPRTCLGSGPIVRHAAGLSPHRATSPLRAESPTPPGIVTRPMEPVSAAPPVIRRAL